MPFRSPDASLPLTPISFEILLALLSEDRHGYAILQTVERRLRGHLPMRTGTMYRALARLVDEGLIVAAAAPAVKRGGAETDERRRYYRITPQGRRIARAEAERLADQVAAARAHRLLGDARR
jgi:DNA-binding PadR family transcriptional regulator